MTEWPQTLWRLRYDISYGGPGDWHVGRSPFPDREVELVAVGPEKRSEERR
jgi:hypothetical protein